MRFDDRLNTLLMQPAGDGHARAVRWRQLVELVARSGRALEAPLLQRALEEIRGDSPQVSEQVRAAAARAIASLPAPAGLVALFATDSPNVAAPLLAAAKLQPAEWASVVEAASEPNRVLLRGLHPELARSGSGEPPEQVAAASPQAESAVPSISDVVARIERLRRGRERSEAAETKAPPTEEGTSRRGTALFRWECTPSGEIAWVEGVPRGPLIGRSLAEGTEGEPVDPAICRAFALRSPFRDGTLVLPGETEWSGEWRISGAPAFELIDGRFAGYRGIGVRPAGHLAEPNRAGALSPDHDALRELVHEIRTPLNAIIGFAEMIDREILGPAGERYRSRAGEIVNHARLLFEAVDDLDLAARLRSGRDQPGRPVSLHQLTEEIGADLRHRATARQVRLAVARRTRGEMCMVQSGVAGRLVCRFVEALVEVAAAEEQLVFRVTAEGSRCLLTVNRPASFPKDAPPAGLLAGSALRLRLLQGLVRLGGGSLDVEDATVVLALPGAAADV